MIHEQTGGGHDQLGVVGRELAGVDVAQVGGRCGAGFRCGGEAAQGGLTHVGDRVGGEPGQGGVVPEHAGGPRRPAPREGVGVGREARDILRGRFRCDRREGVERAGGGPPIGVRVAHLGDPGVERGHLRDEVGAGTCGKADRCGGDVGIQVGDRVEDRCATCFAPQPPVEGGERIDADAPVRVGEACGDHLGGSRPMPGGCDHGLPAHAPVGIQQERLGIVGVDLAGGDERGCGETPDPGRTRGHDSAGRRFHRAQ